MRIRLLAVLAAIVGGGASTPVGAQSAAPADFDGRALAVKLCSSCHAVEPGAATVPRADVPTFSAIANGPVGTPERLAAAIILPHPAMPDVSLTRAEIQAVIGYIMTLKK